MFRRNFLSFCSILPFVGQVSRPRRKRRFNMVASFRGLNSFKDHPFTGQAVLNFGHFRKLIHHRGGDILAEYIIPNELRYTTTREELAEDIDNWLAKLDVEPEDLIVVWRGIPEFSRLNGWVWFDGIDQMFICTG